jgi:hypothetical protein
LIISVLNKRFFLSLKIISITFCESIVGRVSTRTAFSPAHLLIKKSHFYQILCKFVFQIPRLQTRPSGQAAHSTINRPDVSVSWSLLGIIVGIVGRAREKYQGNEYRTGNKERPIWKARSFASLRQDDMGVAGAAGRNEYPTGNKERPI